MRYLKLREEFIRNNNFSNHSLIKEALGNEMPWGDSLLGRLINSVIRKAEIGINLTRIDSVVQRLKDEFDRILTEGVVETLDKEDKSLINRIKFSSILGRLKKAVDDGEEVDVIRTITMSLINEVTDYKTTPEGEATKKELLGKLNEFLKSIEGETKKTAGGYDKTIFPKMAENFASVYNILCHYNKMKKETGAVQKKLGQMEKETGLTGSAVSITTNKKVDKGDLDKQSYTWSINEQETIKATQSNHTFDPKLGSAIRPLHTWFGKGSVGQFIFDGTELKGLGSDQGWKNLYREKSISIYKMYNVVRSLFKLPKIESSANESIDDILGKHEDAGKFIFNLYNVTKTKESGDFDGVGEEMKAEIIKFNSTMKEILSYKVEATNTEPAAGTEKKEESSILKRYSQFILLKEAEEVDKQEEASSEEGKKEDNKDPEEGKKEDNKVKESFYTIFNKDYLLKWSVVESEAKGLEDKIEKTSKDVKHITINGTDPIVEIVKIFNRAWKIHTTSTIQSGRKEGKVSNRTFREYTWMGDSGGGGKPSEPSVGAWRNNALFNKWEDAVLDIIKNSKYQVIFNDKTSIKVGEADTRKNVEITGKPGQEKAKQGGGKTLLKFMNEMLDSDKLYKKGAQSKFIEEYFNVKIDDKEFGFTPDDIKSVNTTSEKILTPSKQKMHFKLEDKINIEESGKGILSSPGVYAISVVDQIYYLSTLNTGTDFLYTKISKSFHGFEKDISPLIDGKVDTGDMSKSINREQYDVSSSPAVLYPIYYAKTLKNRLKDSEVVIKGIDTLIKDSEKVDTIVDKKQIGKIFRVSNEKGEPLVIPANILSKMDKDYSTKIKPKLNK